MNNNMVRFSFSKIMIKFPKFQNITNTLDKGKKFLYMLLFNN